ncbi:MAG TPA: hypothetical protein VD858_05135, partial [Reyranella sp.]|nr:hypothetical protein [Reyranella sp.]
MRFRFVTAASLLVLAACTTASQLAAYHSVEGQIRSYYERHAMELNGSCTMPRIQAITRATPIR